MPLAEDRSSEHDTTVVAEKYTEANASLLSDGRFAVHLRQQAQKLSTQLEGKTIKHRQLSYQLPRKKAKQQQNRYAAILGKYAGCPRMNIVIHIVGSRGDVQPFIPIAQCLMKPPYSHRVRICTHPVFKEFVEENGLEFFSIGGDPATLMAYMVKNPGLLPGLESLRAGDVGKRRKEIGEMLHQAWRSCIEPGDGMSDEATVVAEQLNSNQNADKLFIADAIIANPPSFAHLHCAERLGIPMHLIFTMPWSPTQSFSHPLASMERNNVDTGVANFLSYTMMELLSWQGLGDVINGFRAKTLKLDPISPLWGHMLLSRMRVPFTYLWSSALIPKPSDWGHHIQISGFSFLSLASSYKPPDDLTDFLNAGPPPVYIGFGSIVVDKPQELTELIFRAVKKAGVRALVSKGWGGLGGEKAPEGVFLLGNVPHDWLFNRVSCVVHHGGAGTTAIGIALGKPTVVVPFFGDQPFWGASIFRAGAGPEPVPYKKMTDETLARSITIALSPEVQEAATRMSQQIQGEDGAKGAVEHFIEAANLSDMSCTFCPDRVAIWRLKKPQVKLSGLAAAILVDDGIIQPEDLRIIRHRDWYVDEGAEGPFSGLIAAVSGTLTSAFASVGDLRENLSKVLRQNKGQQKSLAVPPAYESPTDFLEPVQSHIHIRPLSSYPPHYLEQIAREMASETLPSKAKRKRCYVASKKPPKNMMHAVARNTRYFARDMASVTLRSPVTLFYNLANGFHNTPSYYFNDKTVRRRENITGIASGFKVAGKSFTFGLYDGITGVITHPYDGAAANGAEGFTKGIGTGIVGLVFKPIGGSIGLLGYTMKGFEREAAKRAGRSLTTRILAVRLRQGIDAFEKASEAEKERVRKIWAEILQA